MRRILTAATLTLTLFVPRPAHAQNREHQQMFADLRMLQEQVQQLRLAVNTLAETVKTVNTKQDDQANAIRKSFADQKVLTDQLTDSIRILREKGDDTNVRMSTLSHELETLRQSLQSLQNAVVQALAALSAQTPQTAAPPAGGDPAAQPPPTAPAGPPATTQSPQVLYENAWSDYMSSNWNLAITGFQAYLRTFPTSPDAYKAQFNIGEAYKYSNRHREAVQAYTAVITNYKGCPWEDQAYYARGLAYEQLAMKDQARADFQYVIKTFPDSNYVPLSKSALERIK
ncbi:MAG: tetratricopeptide repeat protein [Acidobacteria bacterium]|nr:MAG: tetratricopeptide repeat protein [Acidobacteriota bacterium]